MTKLIGHARVSTRDQSSQRQVDDIVASGVRIDDLYVDDGFGGSRTDRPALQEAVHALERGDTLVVTTLDRLGRSTNNVLVLARELDYRSVGLRVLNLGGANVENSTPMSAMLFTVMAAIAQMELEIKRERIRDSVAKRRLAGHDLGGRRQKFTESQMESAPVLMSSGAVAAQVARDLGMSRATLYRRLGDAESMTK